MSRKWVAVCSGDNDLRVLLRFDLPEKEKWNFVDGDSPAGECTFKDTVDGAEEYALGHIVAGDNNLAFEAVFKMEFIGQEAWERLPEMKKAHSLIGDNVEAEEMTDSLINSGVNMTVVRRRV